MVPVMQTRFGDPDGNCFEAAIASVLEVSLDDVPVLASYRNDSATFWEVLFDWLRDEHELCLVLALAKGSWIPEGVYHLISGLSPRGIKHTVVGQGGVMVHDPHPEGGGVLDDSVCFFVPTWDR